MGSPCSPDLPNIMSCLRSPIAAGPRMTRCGLKRESEVWILKRGPGKTMTGAPCFNVPGSSRVPPPRLRDGQTSLLRPRLVVSRSKCPPLSSSPHANSFVIGTATTHSLEIPPRQDRPIYYRHPRTLAPGTLRPFLLSHPTARPPSHCDAGVVR